MQRISNIMIAGTMIGAFASGAHGQGNIQFELNETNPGSWMLFATVTENTGGLAAYSFNVFGTAAEIAAMAVNCVGGVGPSGCDAVAQEALGGADSANAFAPTGFLGSLQGPIGSPGATQYNAGDSQNFANAIFNIGINPVSVPSMLPIPVVTGVPAKILTVSTGVDLTQPGAVSVNGGLYDLSGQPDGFLNAQNTNVLPPIITPLPEPTTLAALVAAGVTLIGRRRR